MSDKPKSSDTSTALNNESAGFGSGRQGSTTFIIENTVQRVDPAPKRPPTRPSDTGDKGDDAGSKK